MGGEGLMLILRNLQVEEVAQVGGGSESLIEVAAYDNVARRVAFPNE